MSVKNLWKLPENIDTKRTPTTILSEQAHFLAKMTKELLRAYVNRKISGSFVLIKLIVSAPALNHYAVTVLEVNHSIFSPFPSHIKSQTTEISEEVESEEDFVNTIKRILESEKVEQLLGSLLRESLVGEEEMDLPF